MTNFFVTLQEIALTIYTDMTRAISFVRLELYSFL